MVFLAIIYPNNTREEGTLISDQENAQAPPEAILTYPDVS